MTTPSEFKHRTEEVKQWSARKLNTRLAQLKQIILTAQLEKDYINKLDDHRQSIIGGAVKNYESLSRASVNNSSRQMIKTRQGKRKFDLPKPRLFRPFLIIKHKQQNSREVKK